MVPQLVNKIYQLEKDYVPENLVFVPSFTEHLDSTHQIYVVEEVNIQFQRMSEACPIPMYIDSGYRSFEYQQALLDDFYKRDGEQCFTYVALPGTSEHQTGLAVDFGFLNPNTKLPSNLPVEEHTDAFLWVVTHAHLFGFVIRYPKGKESITGYQYEPWHLRYVGLEVAKEIYETKEVLEEYVERKRSYVKRI